LKNILIVWQYETDRIIELDSEKCSKYFQRKNFIIVPPQVGKIFRKENH